MFFKPPFLDIDVAPLHGSRSAVISWKLAPTHTAAEIHVYYSASGVEGSWERRNTAPIVNTNMYADTSFVMQNRADIGYYRLLAVLNGDKFPSDPFPIFSKITPKEYGIVNRAAQAEWQVMRAMDGIPMFHCIPKDHGDKSSTIDPDTGQTIGVECPDKPTDPTDPAYGEAYKGGFWTPILTWVCLRQMSIANTKDKPFETGLDSYTRMSARLLGFPRPSTGHMFVNPVTDDRYVLDSKTAKSFYLRGAVPVAHEAQIVLLRRNDPRYKLPMPDEDIMAFRKSKDYKIGRGIWHSL